MCIIYYSNNKRALIKVSRAKNFCLKGYKHHIDKQ